MAFSLLFLTWHYENTNTMTKEEALQKIEELKAFIEKEDKIKITQYPTKENPHGDINGIYALSLSDDIGCSYQLYLAGKAGKWIDKSGNTICGYLKFIPD